jgi:hypothetical protein
MNTLDLQMPLLTNVQTGFEKDNTITITKEVAETAISTIKLKDTVHTENRIIQN